jgi:hypothetical protein
MNRVLALAATIEGLTGLAMIVDPVIATRLLLGGEVSEAAMGLVRIGGAGLLALGIGDWPGVKAATDNLRPLRSMLTYNVLVTLLLLYLGVRGEWVGVLLWPAAVLHAIVTSLLVRSWFRARETAAGA